METTETNRGKMKLSLDGFMYTEDKISSNRTQAVTSKKRFWRCVRRRTGCVGRIHTTLDLRFIGTTKAHNHPPDQTAVEADKIKYALTTKGLKTDANIDKLFKDVVDELGGDTIEKLPRRDGLKKWLERRKKRVKKVDESVDDDLTTIPIIKQINDLRAHVDANGLEGSPIEEVRENLPALGHEKSAAYRKLKAKVALILPKSLDTLKLEGAWRQTLDGHEFLLCENGESDKILIFSTLAFFRKVCSADIAYMEGSFKSAPKLFKQTYTISMFINDLLIPVAYILLPDCTSEVYIRMFQQLRNEAQIKLGIDFKPHLIQVDFEHAVISAINQVFCNQMPVKGCHFQFAKAIWTNVASNLQQKYKDNAHFQKFINRIYSLPYLPFDLIDEICYAIFREAPACDSEAAFSIQKFRDYIYQTFVDDIAPRFDRSIWCHFGSVGNKIACELEGWNYVVNRSLSLDGPTLFKYIDAIKKQQKQFQQDISVVRKGGCVKMHKVKYVELGEKLTRYKSELTDPHMQTRISPLEYLDRVAAMCTLRFEKRKKNSHNNAKAEVPDSEAPEEEVAPMENLETLCVAVYNEM